VACELVQERANVVDEARMIPREELERDQRRAAAGWAFVLEPSAQELRFLAEAELPDGAIRDGPLAVIGRAREAFDLVLPFRPERGELLFLSALGKSGRFGSG
jgi:hypothetical protein